MFTDMGEIVVEGIICIDSCFGHLTSDSGESRAESKGVNYVSDSSVDFEHRQRNIVYKVASNRLKG